MEESRFMLQDQLAILALKEEGRRVEFLGCEKLCRAWAAAGLTELFLRQALEFKEGGRLKTVANLPGDLDANLGSMRDAIASHKAQRRVGSWIRRIGEKVSERTMLRPILDAGIIKDDRGRYWAGEAVPTLLTKGTRGFIPQKIRLRQTLRDIVFTPAPEYPGMHTFILLALLRRFRLLKLAFTRDERGWAHSSIYDILCNRLFSAKLDEESGGRGPSLLWICSLERDCEN